MELGLPGSLPDGRCEVPGGQRELPGLPGNDAEQLVGSRVAGLPGQCLPAQVGGVPRCSSLQALVGPGEQIPAFGVH